MADWPATLPTEFPEDGFTLQPASGVIRTQMDIGPAKTRKRTSSVVESFSGTLVMTRNQYQNVFLPFYHNNIASGATAFNWTHPISGNNREMRIVSAKSVGPAGGELISLQLDMEILP